jgi:hypothetical protein
MDSKKNNTNVDTVASSTSNELNDPEIIRQDETSLPTLHFDFKKWTLAGYIIFLIVCNVLIPCLLFYLLEIFTKFNDQELIGVSSSALGLSSCIDSPVRLLRCSFQSPSNDLR